MAEVVAEVVAVIPFRQLNPKSRLSLFLNRKEREELAFFMLIDVLKTVFNSGVRDVVILLQSEEKIEEMQRKLKPAKLQVDTRDLNTAINDVLNDLINSSPVAVIVSDLPLLNEKILRKFLQEEGDVVIAPGRRGGTNMLLVRKPFRTSYHYGSFVKHVSTARFMNLKLKIFDSFFAGCDVDTPDDLLEVLLHAPDSNTGKYLKKLGFRVVLEKNPRLVRVLTG